MFQAEGWLPATFMSGREVETGGEAAAAAADELEAVVEEAEVGAGALAGAVMTSGAARVPLMMGTESPLEAAADEAAGADMLGWWASLLGGFEFEWAKVGESAARVGEESRRGGEQRWKHYESRCESMLEERESVFVSLGQRSARQPTDAGPA